MKFDMVLFNKSLKESDISVIYSGPIWAGGIDGIAEMLQNRLSFDEMPLSASQSVFSVFVEQMNNMLMYSAEKETFEHSSGAKEAARGIFVLGIRERTYFVNTGNFVTVKNADILKNRIEYLNNMDKQELRKFFKEQARSENNNEESKGAGLGLIEIARRATSKIEYELLNQPDGMVYFTMHVTI